MIEAPELGAIPDDLGTVFRAWAPHARRVGVQLDDRAGASATQPLDATSGGWFEGRLANVAPGTLYRLVVDGRALPDPYARFLPQGVHGPAEIVRRCHTRPLRPAVPLRRHVFYELHVGAFTPEGTYAAAQERLGDLVSLGITAVEIMPVSAFPGARGWGYDGVAHFAPYAPYGRPEALRSLIERAHALGLSMILDVVYNHFGPRGNYLGAFAPEYFHANRDGPWGSAPDYRVASMRRYVFDNARMWFQEYGFDGLRLDATHALLDESPMHVLRALRDEFPDRLLIAEDDRNDPTLVTAMGLDAIWADDFHHQLRVLLTGEQDGYYGAYRVAIEDLARTIERGWLYEGQRYEPWGRARGAPARALDPACFVYCVENHDQVGNRAFGTRLDRDAGVKALRAATEVLLFLPMTPLLFMGQEWAAASPFLFFSDHEPDLGRLVAMGRRREFARFRAFGDPALRETIPDPQDRATFEASKLRWDEREREPHRSFLRAIREALRRRRDDPVLSAPCDRRAIRASVEGGLLCLERTAGRRRARLLANLSARPVSGLEPFATVLLDG
ncbi:MAG TPA: malto-oligosyltrehalose trehalohydrolase [Polyangiaceae bacterium]|nr:malto-oligosyltrehalose trehalohydrolase [Polyangiaceae bacterium]